jgi:glycosyltransferase involved in cell wall biosynthesis
MIRSQPKLLFFVTVDWFFCSHFLARAVAAQKAGYEVIVLTRVEQHGEIIRDAGIRLLPLKISRSSLSPLGALRTLIHVVRVYRTEFPDIVHHVALKPILLGTLAARVVGLRRVVNAVVGGGYAFSSERPLARLLRPLVKNALKLLLNPQGSRVIFENKDDLESFSRTGLVRLTDSVLICGAGVDPSGFQPAVGVYDPPVIVLVARLLWDKGVGEFVEAARMLRERGVSARFVIVGGPDPENRACIDAAIIDSWREEGIVELWGFRNDIPQVLAGASIACLPSYREGLPKSLLESMAAGLPCVTTDVPGCREAVRDGDNGLLVPAKNPSALADALELLIKNPEMARKMGERGRERLENEFSAQQVNSATLSLYRKMLGK